jgi:hypothetical protein
MKMRGHLHKMNCEESIHRLPSSWKDRGNSHKCGPMTEMQVKHVASMSYHAGTPVSEHRPFFERGFMADIKMHKKTEEN